MLYKEIMKKEEILLQVQNIFRDILDNESIELTGETTANDVDEWDSLSHIQLIVAIEKQFKIKFTSREILSWKNVGEMIDSMAVKITC
ncbi:Acyl carrier protein [termite gut metagenome]|uniref:Acyl carrier protein n=1 Tax=termite gut metagenome TaxID=433724 RepID=A0A5J4QNS1_9ZZZZ